MCLNRNWAYQKKKKKPKKELGIPLSVPSFLPIRGLLFCPASLLNVMKPPVQPLLISGMNIRNATYIQIEAPFFKDNYLNSISGSFLSFTDPFFFSYFSVGSEVAEGKGCYILNHHKAKQEIPLAQMVKNLPATQKTWVRPLGWEDPLEEGMATHSSILAWRVPMDRGVGQAAVHGVTKNRT